MIRPLTSVSRTAPVAAAFLLFSLALGACGSDSAEDAADAGAASDTGATTDGSPTGDTGTVDPPPIGDGPTYHADIAPILSRSCAGCHQAGSFGPFPLTTFAESGPLATLLADTVEQLRMPPWGLETTDDCAPRHKFKNDLRLTPDEIALIRAWADTGAQEGDPATAAETTIPEKVKLSRVDLELKPAEPYITEGAVDEFICFPVDPKFVTDVFVQGSLVVPGNTLVAHHALIFTDPKAQSTELAGDKGWYPCFGDAQVDDSSLLTVWAPGGLPNELPANAGMPVAAGTLLVIQMHYHPTGTTAEADQTALQLKFTTETPEWLSLVALIGNFTDQNSEGFGLLPGENDKGGVEFRVPAGAASHTEKMSFLSPSELGGQPNVAHRILAVAPHMHYLGRRMVSTVARRERTAPLCPASEALPLVTCLQSECGEADDVEACAAEKCSDELGNLSGLCEGCLIGQLNVQPEAGAAFGVCMAAPEYDAAEQPESECFFESPQYDFTWQRIYEYDAPIEELPVVFPGDVLDFECVYDNSTSNQQVVDALAYQGLDSPIDVHLGDTTLDEMCLLVLQTLYKPYELPPAE